ncbi:PRTRC system ParB family protein [Metallibacterium scheffleri]|nr:PRTRC system ParB family protein [Metallibacterium scheffleri]
MNTTAARGETATIPVASIHVVEGFNPRRAFREDALNELIASIKADGLIQAITVRRLDDESYSLIAGERRLRACKAIGFAAVPALIVDCDEHTARTMALKENTVRDDLSVAEEALAAREAMDLCGGDLQATATQLGWSLTRLQSRLLLLTASPDVLDAVAHRAITVAHAELLAGLPFEAQDKLCTRIIESNVSVADLREQLKGVLIPLSRAIFDRSGCAGCPHNTEHQRSLFDNGLDGSFCKKKACFNEKTIFVLETKRASLKDDFQTVAFDSEKDPATYTPLSTDGATGVGTEQFAACRQCMHYGALVHDKPDGRQGTVSKPVCFSVACNRQKIEAARAATVAAEGPKVAPANDAVPAVNGQAPAKAAAAPKKAVVPSAAGVASATRKLMVPAYEAAAKQTLTQDARVPIALSILAIEDLMKASGMPFANLHGAGATKDHIKRLSEYVSKPMNELLPLYRARLEQMVSLHPANSYAARSGYSAASAAAAICHACSVSLSDHFTMTTDYLLSLTREGIEAVLDESGFAKWMQAQPDGTKRLKGILAEKKAASVTSIMAAGFDWKHYVPSAVLSVSPAALADAT